MDKEKTTKTTRRTTRSLASAFTSDNTVTEETNVGPPPAINLPVVEGDPAVDKEGTPQIPRRTTRSLASASNSDHVATKVNSIYFRSLASAFTSDTMVTEKTNVDPPPTISRPIAEGDSEVDKEGAPQIPRRTTRSLASASNSDHVATKVNSVYFRSLASAFTSDTMVTEETNVDPPPTISRPIAEGDSEVDKEGAPQIPRRTTRSLASASNSDHVATKVNSIYFRSLASAFTSDTMVTEETNVDPPPTISRPIVEGDSEVDKEGAPQIPRRTTRSLASASNSDHVATKVTSIYFRSLASAFTSDNTLTEETNVDPPPTISRPIVEGESEVDKEGDPQIPRRTTRSLASASNSDDAVTKVTGINPPTINDLLVGGDPINLDDLISTFPGRRSQILELVRLLGPLNSPILPLFVYGGPSTGKTSIILQLFKHLNRPLVYSSCSTCYNQRILFESILNSLFLHRKSAANGYSNAKRCERPSDFINFLREALTNVINNLKENSEKLRSNKVAARGIGNMIYLVFDNFHLVREWDKSSTVLPFLFNLYDLLNMPEVGLIFISSTCPDTYYADMGYVEPIPVFFPDYTEDDLHQIFLRNQENQKLYSSFLGVVLRPFCRITRQVDELFTAFKSLFEKYCEPLSDHGVVPSEDMKRRLFSHLKPHIGSYLNEIFKVSSLPSLEVETHKETKRKGNPKKLERPEEIEELEFHMSTCAKYLLISAFLASRNPATLDDSLFDSTGGSNSRKRKRKTSTKVQEQKQMAEEELLMKGPGTFPLERLLAIFQCIVSVAEDPSDEEEQRNDGLGIQGGKGGLMSDVLLQLSSLCNANFIIKGGSCPIEGSTRYRSTISEDLALKVARSLKFPLSKYLYRR